MNPGKLNRRIILQRQDVSRDVVGQAKPVWTDIATVWAAVLPLRGREYFESAKVNSEITVRVVIRYRADVKPSWRVKHGADAYDIIEIINPADGKRELQLMCKRVA